MKFRLVGLSVCAWITGTFPHWDLSSLGPFLTGTFPHWDLSSLGPSLEFQQIHSLLFKWWNKLSENEQNHRNVSPGSDFVVWVSSDLKRRTSLTLYFRKWKPSACSRLNMCLTLTALSSQAVKSQTARKELGDVPSVSSVVVVTPCSQPLSGLVVDPPCDPASARSAAHAQEHTDDFSAHRAWSTKPSFTGSQASITSSDTAVSSLSAGITTVTFHHTTWRRELNLIWDNPTGIQPATMSLKG